MIDFTIQAERNDWDDEQVAIWMNRRIDLVDVAIDIAHNLAAVTELGAISVGAYWSKRKS